jgi:sugar lactone lactonase YvrE
VPVAGARSPTAATATPASKQTSGALVCVVRRDGRLDRFTPRRRAPLSDHLEPERLADCAIADDGTVWTGDNGFGLGEVRQWAITADGATLLGRARLGVGFPEVLAFGPDHAVYRLSDLGGAPSLATAFRCPSGLPKAGPADADG